MDVREDNHVFWKYSEKIVKIGLKLYSTDVALIDEAQKLQGNYLHFIELYVVPGSHPVVIDAWQRVSIPFVIHAPHSFHGVNLAQQGLCESNLRHLRETRRFADDLSSRTIIVHGGNNGDFQETLRQIRLVKDPRIVLENKPRRGLLDEECVGWSPGELRLALETGAVSDVVLDFVHASCAARSENKEAGVLIDEFLTFNPRLFHLSDGERESEKDTHINFGRGNLDIRGFLSVVPEGGWVTIEAPRDPSKGLADFVDDVTFLRKVLSKPIGGRSGEEESDCG